MTEDLPSLDLICFGPPTVRLDGQAPPPELQWHKHLALLIYLALSPGRARTRDHLVGLLWGERPQDKARHAFNEALRRLRGRLGAERLESRGDAVVLNDLCLDVDAWRFDTAAERDPEKAVSVYRGDFLEGFAVQEAREFDDWASTERERYRSRAAAALVALGEARLTRCQFTEAQDAARRVLALEPYAEPALRLLMRAAALTGDTAGAFVAYRDFSARLTEELGEPPSRALVALAERIRQGSWRPTAAPEADPEPPLVGRDEVHRTVFNLLATGLTDGPQTLVITGAPGAGHTRLLSECVERLALEGAVVAQARPLESDHDAPWSTLRALLRAGLPRAPGLVAADPEALGVLAGLVPEIVPGSPPQPRESLDGAHLAGALASVLRAVAEERPIILAVDDAHLADGPSLGVLGAAVEQLVSAPVVFVLAAIEAAEMAPHELTTLRGAVGRRLRGVTVRLDPLTDPDLLVLVSALAPWCRDDDERDRLARRLMFETRGNPFFAVSLLEGLRRLDWLRADFVAWPRPHSTFDTPMPISVPVLARMAIAARVADLETTSQRVLSAASVAGLALDLDLVAALTDLPRAGVEERLPSLERRHLIMFDGERYTFAAPIVARAVRSECLTRGQQQALRQRAVGLLASRTDLETRVLRAELLARVEPGESAFVEAVAVTRAALAARSPRTARRALAAAERAVKPENAAAQQTLTELRRQVEQGTS